MTGTGIRLYAPLPPTASRRRRTVAAVLVVVAVPLIWLDWSHDLSLIFPTFLGLGAIAAAARVLHWDVGAREQERARAVRVAAYRGRSRHV